MKRGFTLVEVMIVVAIIALLAAVAIPQILRARLVQNEAAAQATLRTVATAFENYAAANKGQYPTDIDSQLVNVTPRYLDKNYFSEFNVNKPYQGYFYAIVNITGAGYNIVARPQVCSSQGAPGTGSKSYTVTAGGVLSTDTICTDTAP